MNNDTYEIGIRLWAQWTQMWNGAPALARELVAERFALHLTEPTSVPVATVTTPASVEAWVAAHRARFTSITFHSDAGPFVDTVAGVVAGPWFAEIEVAGVKSVVCGMDTIAFRNGKVTEYWTLSKEAERVGDWTRSLGL